MASEFDVTDEELFDLFWQMYPRKVGKKLCQTIWHRKIDSNDVDAIYTGLRKMRKSEQWKKDGGKYIPHPSTFLNQERWNDEVGEEDAQLNLKEPQTEEEVYIALLFNSFGIKTYCNSNEKLLQCFKTNEREINSIKTYCSDIIKTLQVVNNVREYLESKGFTWTWRSIAANFPYHLAKYEQTKERYKRRA